MKYFNIVFITLLISITTSCDSQVTTNSQTTQEKKISMASGYKDLKFGMSKNEVDNLGVCKLFVGSLGIYKCYDKFVNLYEDATFEAPLIEEGSGVLVQIQVGLGDYTDEKFTEYQNLISSKYSVEKVFSKSDMELFNIGQLDTLNTIFANGSVVLKIFRNPQNGGFMLDIIYNNKKVADDLMKASFPKKDNIDDV